MLKISHQTESVIRDQLEELSRRVPLQVWMVTTVSDGEWKIVYAHNRGYSIVEGQVFDWQGTFCCRMMANEGPQFASNAQDCEAYRNSPIGKTLPITIYVGVPIYGDGNQFFGTLCGLDPQPAVAGIRSSEARVRRTADIIGKLLSMEHKLAKIESATHSVEGIAWRDEMTGLLNRRGWNRIVEKADAVTQGRVHAVVMLDLDKLKRVNDEKGHAAGDKLIVDGANVLAQSMRGDDVVARMGGDEFGLLLQDVYPRQLDDIVERIGNELATAKIAATIGYASSPPYASIALATEAADQMLIGEKKQRSSE